MGRYDDPKWHAQTEEAPAPVSRYANPKFYKRDPSTLELIGNASAKGVAGLLDSLGNAPANLANLGIMAVGAPMVALGKPEWAPDTLPTPDLARRGLTAINSIHPDAEPATDEQRLLDSVVQGAVGGLFSPAKGGAQILSNLGLGSLSGGAADLATSATGSPVAGLAAAMLTPMGAAGAATLGRKLVPNAQSAAGKKLIKAADDPEALRRALARTDHEIVPGSHPTTAEVAMQPGISQAQRSAINMNYGPLTDRAAQQNTARVAQLERIAPGATKVTPIEAADNAGGVVFKLADKNRQAFKAARGAAYHSPVLDSASLTLPTGAGARAAIETFYPGVSFETAPADLRRLASLMDAGGQVPLKEFDALRKQAGNRAADLADSDRTASAAWSKVKGLFDDAEAAAIARSAEKFAVTGNGPWGPEFGNLAGDPENAVAHLLRMGKGSVPQAAKNPMAGPVDFVAGNPVAHGNGAFGVLHIDAADKKSPVGAGQLSRETGLASQSQPLANPPGTSSIDDAMTGLLQDAAATRNPPPPAPPPRNPRQYVGGLPIARR